MNDGEGSFEETPKPMLKIVLFLQTNDRITEEHNKALNKLEIFYTENHKKVHFQSLISEYFNSF